MGHKSTVMLVYSQWEDCAHEAIVHADHFGVSNLPGRVTSFAFARTELYFNVTFHVYFRHQGKIIMLQKRFKPDGKCCQKGKEQ